jgi:CheY-like chemotaxis protein
VLRIAYRHGGRFRRKAKPERGAASYVALKLHGSEPMRDRHILFVEDSDNDIELTLAASPGMSPTKWTSRATVLRRPTIYRRGAFAGRASAAPVLVMLDLKMPKLDRLELLRTIRRPPRSKQIPVVVLSSSRESVTSPRLE